MLKHYRTLLILALTFGLTYPALALRLISTSPQITELLFQLRKGGDIIGTSAGSDFPIEAKQIPVLGPLFMPGVERSVLLQPDWIVLDKALSLNHYAKTAQSLGIKTLSFDVPTVEALFTESERLLKILYGEKPSTVEKYNRCYRSLRSQKKNTKPFTYLTFVAFSPPILLGRTTFQADLIHHFGGVSLIPKRLNYAFPKVSEEWLIKQQVDTIFYFAYKENSKKLVMEKIHRWWPRNSIKVVALDPDVFSRSTFTVFHHLNSFSSALPKVCHAL